MLTPPPLAPSKNSGNSAGRGVEPRAAAFGERVEQGPPGGLELVVVLRADRQAGAADRRHPRAGSRQVDLDLVRERVLFGALIAVVAGGEEEADALGCAGLEDLVVDAGDRFIVVGGFAVGVGDDAGQVMVDDERAPPRRGRCLRSLPPLTKRTFASGASPWTDSTSSVSSPYQPLLRILLADGVEFARQVLLVLARAERLVAGDLRVLVRVGRASSARRTRRRPPPSAPRRSCPRR